MKKNKIRYGVVGLGHIAQSAVLPAFLHASNNSELTALISDDPKKLKELSKKYNVDHTFSMKELKDCLQEDIIDVLYVATPNDTHKEIVEMAASQGVHILCEKPMAVTENECIKMAEVAKKNNVKLMIAYRLHFQAANLEVVKLCREGKIGDLKFFNSTFSYQVSPDNIRVNPVDMGGGPLYDIGIYCINAARYIFAEEPIEVMCIKGESGDKRFAESEESASVLMKFPKGKLCTFTVSFGAFESADFDIVGTKGRICLEKAYEYTEPMTMTLYQKGTTKDVKVKEKHFKKTDQFAAELHYFSDCVQKNITPEPGPVEGLADVRILEAIHKSARLKKPITIEAIEKMARPTKKQEIKKASPKKVKTIHVQSPHK